MSSNSGSYIDEDGNTYDWIELYNGTSEDVNLKDYGLSDDVSGRVKWKFPNITIKSKEYLVIFFSGKKESGLKVNFSLSKNGGETITLKNSNGKTIDSVKNKINKGYEIVVKNNRKYLVKKKKVDDKNNMGDMLLSKEDMGIISKVCKEADAIALLIIKRYGNYFSHRIPESGQAPTKTYIGICNKITDIYNGAFLKSRIYPLGGNPFR